MYRDNFLLYTTDSYSVWSVMVLVMYDLILFSEDNGLFLSNVEQTFVQIK